MSSSDLNIKCVACSIFKHALESIDLIKKNQIHVEFLNSMLHMHPDKLNDRLTKIIEENTPGKQKMFLLYGDCAPFMLEFQTVNNVERVPGINCIEILLEKEVYRKLRKEGAFFLLPEWAFRWKEIFEFELGLKGSLSKEFLKEFHTKLVYLNTKQVEIPYELLKEISAHFEMPYEIIEIDESVLTNKIEEILKRITNG